MPDYVVVPNAGHFVFVAWRAEMARRAPVIRRDAADFDREAFHPSSCLLQGAVAVGPNGGSA